MRDTCLVGWRLGSVEGGVDASGPGLRIYFDGLDGLRGARLDAARGAGFVARGVAAARALPGGLWSAPPAPGARSALSFASA